MNHIQESNSKVSTSEVGAIYLLLLDRSWGYRIQHVFDVVSGSLLYFEGLFQSLTHVIGGRVSVWVRRGVNGQSASSSVRSGECLHHVNRFMWCVDTDVVIEV